MTVPHVRLIRALDVEAVLEMIRSLARHHGDKPMITLDNLRRDALGPNPWVSVLVAEQQDRLTGYSVLCPLVQMQFGVRGMDMHHLFVQPDVRGQGVGRALIEASLATSRLMGCRYMTVGTHPENGAAADVYRAAGFEPLPPPGPRFRIKL
ncbi:MAG: N-acetyltransferase family protein [Sulfitobacter sp.]